MIRGFLCTEDATVFCRTPKGGPYGCKLESANLWWST